MFKIVTHRADILCMSLAPDNSTIYVSGKWRNATSVARSLKI